SEVGTPSFRGKGPGGRSDRGLTANLAPGYHGPRPRTSGRTSGPGGRGCLESHMRIRLPCRAPAFPAALLLVTIRCSRITLVDTVAPSGRDLPATPASSTVAHDLAVTGIDFDPALSTFESRPVDEVILLVVVENRGTESERNVHLSVSLSGPSS